MEQEAVRDQQSPEEIPVEETSEEQVAEEEQSAAILTPEAVKDYLRNNPDALTDEDVYSIPTVRTRMDRAISKQHEELRKKYQQDQDSVQQRRALVGRAREFVTQIDGANAQQLREWGRQNPNLWNEYSEAQKILLDPDNQISQQAATDIYRGLIAEMKTKYPDVDFSSATNVPEVVNLAKDAEIKVAMAQMKKQFEAEFESLRQELSGKRVVEEEEQPEVEPSTTIRYKPDSFEDIEDKYARGLVSSQVYQEALAKRR